MTRILLSAAVVVLVGAASLSAQARYEPERQDVRTYVGDADTWDGYDLPAFVSMVEGYAELDRGGQSSRDIENVPLEAGDRIRTTRGRAEILFDDGSVIALDEHTTVTFATATEVELERGRVRAQWENRGALSGLTIYTQAGSALIRTRGDYRVTLSESRLGEAEIEVAVTQGSAELANDHGRTLVRERTRALTTARYAPSLPYAYSVPRDAFERWTENVQAERYGVESVRYLPTELRYYGGVFDRHGSWHNHHTHGWVWYPRVSADWRPYHGGRWSFVIGFGYSWVGGSRWSWPTHHHGRWDRVGSRWYWIPVRPTYYRAVGYSAPRPSYTVNVAYYDRTAYRTTVARIPQTDYRRPQSGQRSTQPAVRGPQSDGRAPQAVPRTETRPTPQRSTPQAVPRTAPRPDTRPTETLPAPQRSTPQRSAPPQRSTPQQETRPVPQRSAPQPRTAPPPRTVAPQRAEPQRAAPQPRATPPPRAPEPQRAEPQRTAPRPEARPTPQRSAPQPRSAPPETRPAPQRAAPQERTAPPTPPSGSRAPSRTAPPPTSGGGSSDNSARPGTAVRRPSGG